MLSQSCKPDEFADNYGFSRRRVRDLVRRHGLGLKVGRVTVLEQPDIQRLKEIIATPCPSALPSQRAAKTGGFAGRTSASSWTEVAAHLSAQKRKR